MKRRWRGAQGIHRNVGRVTISLISAPNKKKEKESGMKRILLAAVLMIFAMSSFAFAAEVAEPQQKTLEQITKGRNKANITFKELMQIAEMEVMRMFDGFMRQNFLQVELAANTLDNHPMPAKDVAGPGQWMFLVPEKREEFKAAMPHFEKVVHGYAREAAKLAKDGKWEEGYTAYQKMINGCVSCHLVFREWTIDSQLLKKVKQQQAAEKK